VADCAASIRLVPRKTDEHSSSPAALATMTGLPFSPDNPPNEPPAQCMDHPKWIRWRQEYRKHRPDQSGDCRECRERFPCFARQLAVRALIDACTPLRPQQPTRACIKVVWAIR
jgi:hypothetical protein